MIYTDVSCMGVIQRLASLKKWLDKGNELGIHQIRKSWGCKKAYCNHFMTKQSVTEVYNQLVSQSINKPTSESASKSSLQTISEIFSL